MTGGHVQQACRRAPTAGGARACIALALAARVVLGIGCAGTSSILAERLDDGRVVRDIIPHDSPAALLVYDVRACMTCGVAIPVWRSLMRDSTVSVKLILVGDVSDQDRRILKLQRIAISGTITRRSMPVEFLPSEYLFANGVIHAKAVGQEAVRTRRLWAHLASLAGVPRVARP